jgi:hypothetical protein
MENDLTRPVDEVFNEDITGMKPSTQTHGRVDEGPVYLADASETRPLPSLSTKSWPDDGCRRQHATACPPRMVHWTASAEARHAHTTCQAASVRPILAAAAAAAETAIEKALNDPDRIRLVKA